MNHPKQIWQLLRPLEWIKNGFVFTGILFGNQYRDLFLVGQAIVTALAFALASSAIYVINDLKDTASDQHHPKKKDRPIPAGLVSKGAALILSLLCGAAAFLLAISISWKVVSIIIIYIGLNIVYSYSLKHIVILDVFCIATGFMLRILAGTVGLGIPPSKWLLLCGLMITLFLGFTKRRAELIALNHKNEQRQVLENYSASLLDEILAICATGVIMSYSLYTMSSDTIQIHHTTNLIYTVPIVIYALFRYLYLLHHCQSGGDPARDLLKDRHIALSVLSWIALTIYLIH